MFTKDDSRNTYLLDDRYVILTKEAFLSKRKYSSKLSKIDDNFEYSSENNNEILDKKSLYELLKN